MADLVGPLLELVNCIATPTCNHVDNYKNFDGDVNELRGKLGDLNRRKQDIESRIYVEACAGQMVKAEVQGWLQHVQTINDEVQAVLQEARRVKWYRKACLGKHVRRKIDVVKAIHEQGSFPEGPIIARAHTLKAIHEQGSFLEGLVVARAPAQGIIIPTENLEGETAVREKIWEYLMDVKVGMIGVCGIGGVGKTTIMKHVNNDLLRRKMFQKVIWVTVSYPLNVSAVQNNIASAMGKKLLDDEEEMMRVATLMDIMETMRYVLIILDDVWEKFSLKDVGIPEPTEQNGCKIVITSRSVEVCNYLGCKIIEVQPLSPKESLNLFLNKVGRDVLEVPRLEEILNSIVEECDGLPLAIVVIAGSMRGEYDIKEWRNALNELRHCVKSVKGMEDEIFVRLRFSYDRLRISEIQKCFLYCSLFPEDYEFSRKELIEGWIDEGLIDELGSRQEAYDRGHAFLNKLEKNYLLDKIVARDGNYAFKMHDVVRDMAIKSIGSGVGYMVKASMKLREVPDENEWVTDLRKVSLMANNISKIPASLSPKCSTLSTLIFSNNHQLSKIPQSFFKHMGGLKVLDLSATGINALPNCICNLKNLSTLRLRQCMRLDRLPSLAKLRALKKLDLHEAGIKVVPQGMGMLVSLEYLDLFCRNLKEVPRRILSKLSRLQYLVVYTSGKTSIKINLEELAGLSKLETLECELDDIHDFNHFVNKSKELQSLSSYELLVRTVKDSVVDEFSNEHHQRKVIIRRCDIGGERIALPNNLGALGISDCKNMRSSLIEKETKLGKCRISNCEGIECVVELDSSFSSLHYPSLDQLEVLSLWYLPTFRELVRLEGVATPPHIFSNLKSLSICYCSVMRKLITFELVQALQNLRSIHVQYCIQIEEIIASSDSDVSSDNFTLTFPKLWELNLVFLPQLKRICSDKGVMICDSMKEVSISDCPNLKRIPIYAASTTSSSSSQRKNHLTRLHPSLKNILGEVIEE